MLIPIAAIGVVLSILLSAATTRMNGANDFLRCRRRIRDGDRLLAAAADTKGAAR